MGLWNNGSLLKQFFLKGIILTGWCEGVSYGTTLYASSGDEKVGIH